MADKRREYAAKFFPYIEKVARRLARRLPAHVEIDDLISSGVIGLMEAAERFDPKRVDRFEAFAEFRIRGAMLDDLRSRDTLSRDMRRLSNELREATRRLESQLGRTPDQGELADQLGLDVDELYARQQKLSGSSVVGIDDAGPDFLERTGDETAPDPFEVTAHREALARLVYGIDDLPEKMQQVLSLYYCENLNLKEIGEVLGVTESRVCQIHGEATRRLRQTLGEHGGLGRRLIRAGPRRPIGYPPSLLTINLRDLSLSNFLCSTLSSLHERPMGEYMKVTGRHSAKNDALEQGRGLGRKVTEDQAHVRASRS